MRAEARAIVDVVMSDINKTEFFRKKRQNTNVGELPGPANRIQL